MTTATQHHIKDMTRDQLLELVEDMGKGNDDRIAKDSVASLLTMPIVDARKQVFKQSVKGLNPVFWLIGLLAIAPVFLLIIALITQPGY